MAWKTCSCLVPCSSKKKKKKQELRLNRWTNIGTHFRLSFDTIVGFVSIRKKCVTGPTRKTNQWLLVHTRHEQKRAMDKSICVFFDESGQLETHARYYRDSMTSKEMRVRLSNDQTASKNNPFIFIRHRADGTLRFPREKLKERKRLLRIRVDFIGAILSKKTVLRILMQRKFDCDGGSSRKFLHFSFPFCLDRCVILKPENWTILFSFVV